MQNLNPTAPRTKKSAPVQPKGVSLPAFLKGQRQINGKLYDVDLKVLQAIIELRDALEKVVEIDTTALNKAIELAKTRASVIPGVDPPGCEYPGGGGLGG